jgi:Rps23 Pro-64 3,4-dihydroxylase Tpa1-like proline 4-hydroxylase
LNKEEEEGKKEIKPQDVAPRGGRLVLFDSAAVPHEVLPSHNKDVQRVALTVWVSDRKAR